jgi:cytochrome c5
MGCNGNNSTNTIKLTNTVNITTTTTTPPATATTTVSLAATATNTSPVTTTTTNTPAPLLPTTIVPPVTTTTANPSATSTADIKPTLTKLTFQTLAEKGAIIYSKSCGRCHDGGSVEHSGSPLWWSGATLGLRGDRIFFANNAQAMLEYISKSMPFTAAGSLTSQDLYSLTCYILVDAGLVPPSDVYDVSKLGSISIR